VNPNILLPLMAVTFGLAWYAAWGVGRYWTEAKIVGHLMPLITWLGVTLAGLSFTWVYLTILTAAAVATEFLTLRQAQSMYRLGYVFSTGALVGGLIATGLHGLVLRYRRRQLGEAGVAGYHALPNAADTWRAASNATDVLGNTLNSFSGGRTSRVRQRSVASQAREQSIASFDSQPRPYAGGFSLKSIFDGLTSSSSNRGSGDGDSDGGQAFAFMVIVMLAILAIGGGLITTGLIVRHADTMHAADVTAFLEAFDPSARD
jgi:hypothetical protein